MELGRPLDTMVRVRDHDRIKRYTLVPRSSLNGSSGGVRRFSLARVGATPRSALGDDHLDRLERMERIVEAEREQPSNGADPRDRQDSRS